MKKYLTQKLAASKGIITKQMEDVLKKENIAKDTLLEGVVNGSIAIPANKNHKCLIGAGIGKGLATKVNVNLGVSADRCSFESEIQKAELALKYKADAIMDLSVSGNTQKFRKDLVKRIPIMIGTVPIYDTLVRTQKSLKDITLDEWFDMVEIHAEDGIDFITIHAGLNQKCLNTIAQKPRQTGIVSRGGSILAQWMVENQRENPFYENFDRLVEICRKYDVCISLGDGLRPGALKDSTDAPQIEELITLGELVKIAWDQDVQVMVEGPGHMPLNEIEMNMKLQKKLCHDAPFYVLGPIVTDIAPGYDHITSAIGGAAAAMHGADFLCYVTPAEHLRLPDADDVKQGIMAARIAAHAADIANKLPGASDIDNQMGTFRKDLDWEGQFRCAIDPEKARKYSEFSINDVCTMCGDFCAVKRSNKIFKNSCK